MVSDVVVGIEVAGEAALATMKELAGPTNPKLAK
jgi:nucleoside diphosphate kinase